jgi:hypothetical protein
MKTIRAAWCGGILFIMAAGVGYTGASSAGVGEADLSVRPAHAVGADLFEIRDRAETMPIDMRHDIDKRIDVTVGRVNKEAVSKGQTAVAARLASEFGLTSEALLDEKGQHGLSWGELVIAHTLLANSNTGVTLLDLVSLRSDGLGWGAIAFGLRFHMEDLEDAIKAEGRVAMGLSKADGKAAVIGK